MPLHYSTIESVVIVLKGSPQLEIDEIKLMLQARNVFIIQAHQNHTLSVKVKFKASVIMSQDSSIEFVEQTSF